MSCEREVYPGVVVVIPDEGSDERPMMFNRTGRSLHVNLGDWPYSIEILDEGEAHYVELCPRSRPLYTGDGFMEWFGGKPPAKC